MQEETKLSIGSTSTFHERDKLSDMSEESTTEEIAKPTPLRQSNRIKQPTLHCHLHDPQIKEKCDCCEQDT